MPGWTLPRVRGKVHGLGCQRAESALGAFGRVLQAEVEAWPKRRALYWYVPPSSPVDVLIHVPKQETAVSRASDAGVLLLVIGEYLVLMYPGVWYTRLTQFP